ncbi:MAG: 2-oxoglutarate dehydrogenase E2 component (dihydrolipoamide succinyltransferase) [Sphingobacteriales bacterium]|jgi:2-oxoglutarate dehydrogenase E2 component (dihydrolipoamide succinyltransferase)
MALEIKVPSVGESITEVTIDTWLKGDGEYVELDEAICEVESDKATFEIMAEASGTLKHMVAAGDTVNIGDVVCSIDESGSKSSAPKKETTTEAPKEVKVEEKANAPIADSSKHTSPVAAKILNEHNISPEKVSGSGQGGRVTKEDALKAVEAMSSNRSSELKPAAADPAPAPRVAGERGTRREKMSNLRKTLAKRLVAVKNETAMLTTFNEVNMKPIMDLRKQYKDAFKEKHEVGLGFMSFFVKAVSMALTEVPGVNAQLDGNEIIFHDYCDVSIAVSTPKGLVVPVIRNTENLDFAGIEKEVVRLAVKGRDGKLSIEEMTGGTFTITNGGIFGSMLSTPIINPPQSAILGMHNIVERPVAENGQVVIRPIMYLALSYDHRIVDGKESVTFLKRVKEYLEDPQRLLLGV